MRLSSKAHPLSVSPSRVPVDLSSVTRRSYSLPSPVRNWPNHFPFSWWNLTAGAWINCRDFQPDLPLGLSLKNLSRMASESLVPRTLGVGSQNRLISLGCNLPMCSQPSLQYRFSDWKGTTALPRTKGTSITSSGATSFPSMVAHCSGIACDLVRDTRRTSLCVFRSKPAIHRALSFDELARHRILDKGDPLSFGRRGSAQIGRSPKRVV